jgi:hypothetical protein
MAMTEATSWCHGGCVCCLLIPNESEIFFLCCLDDGDFRFGFCGDWDADQHIADDNGPLLIAACLLLLNADIQVAS